MNSFAENLKIDHHSIAVEEALINMWNNNVINRI